MEVSHGSIPDHRRLGMRDSRRLNDGTMARLAGDPRRGRPRPGCDHPHRGVAHQLAVSPRRYPAGRRQRPGRQPHCPSGPNAKSAGPPEAMTYRGSGQRPGIQGAAAEQPDHLRWTHAMYAVPYGSPKSTTARRCASSAAVHRSPSPRRLARTIDAPESAAPARRARHDQWPFYQASVKRAHSSGTATRRHGMIGNIRVDRRRAPLVSDHDSAAERYDRCLLVRLSHVGSASCAGSTGTALPALALDSSRLHDTGGCSFPAARP